MVGFGLWAGRQVLAGEVGGGGHGHLGDSCRDGTDGLRGIDGD